MMEKYGHINSELLSILKNTIKLHNNKLPEEYKEFQSILLEYGYINENGFITKEGKEAVEKGV